MNRQMLTRYEMMLGVDYFNTLMSMSKLTSVLQDQRKYKQAEEMNRRTLVGREMVLGVNYFNTLTSVNKLASVLRNQGKYKQVKEMNRRTLGRERDGAR